MAFSNGFAQRGRHVLESGALSRASKANRIALNGCRMLSRQSGHYGNGKTKAGVSQFQMPCSRLKNGYVDKRTSLRCLSVPTVRRRLLNLEVSLRACPE